MVRETQRYSHRTPDRVHCFVGRLADIIGRKAAMLIALSLFGEYRDTILLNDAITPIRVWYHLLRLCTLDGCNVGSARGFGNGRRRVGAILIPTGLV